MAKISLAKKQGKKIKKRVKTDVKDEKSGEIKLESHPKMKNQKRHYKKACGTIYLGHIPHGFYENEMNSYFNQFGKVISAKVARSKKTGRSKGYGFVEFEDEEVAKIAAETMNNYLMFNRVLKCRYIPPEERKGKIFVRTIDPKNCPRKQNRKIDVRNKNNAMRKLKEEDYRKKAQKKIDDFKKFFEERGIDFSFKINNPDSKDGDAAKDSQDNVGAESNTSVGSESEDDTDDQFGVLEIDESDNEIQFKTPPQVKKVIKRSLNSPLVSSVSMPNIKSPSSKKSESSKLKNVKTLRQKKISKQTHPVRKSKTSSLLQLKTSGKDVEAAKRKLTNVVQTIESKGKNKEKTSPGKTLKKKLPQNKLPVIGEKRRMENGGNRVPSKRLKEEKSKVKGDSPKLRSNKTLLKKLPPKSFKNKT